MLSQSSLATAVRGAHRALVIQSVPMCRTFAALLLLLALTLRMMIPAGWMPAGGKAFALTVCVGATVETVWLDAQGNIHKDDPGKNKSKKVDHAPCAFAGLGSVADMPAGISSSVIARAADALLPFPAIAVSIGHGLAAPPPPAIGPPALV